MVSPTTATTALNPNQEMTDFDYKKYSLENLENWMHDAISSGDATPQEIYDVIAGVVKETYSYHKECADQAYELLSLLNGNGGWTYKEVMKEKEYYEPSMPPWGHSDLECGLSNSFLTQDRNSNFPNENTVCDRDDPSPECQKSWTNFWEDAPYPLYVSEDGDMRSPDAVVKKDKVVKWQLPVGVDELTGDCYVNFPDDLLEAANLKEGDQVEWIDLNNGSFELRKVNGTK
jgi:hypothetical protein